MSAHVIDATSAYAAEVLHELRESGEHLAMLLATSTGSTTSCLTERIGLAPEHVTHERFHVALTDAGRAHVLRTASSREGWLVEMHSHGKFGDPAQFSPTDEAGLAEWVPHLQWRLPGRGYIALVTGGTTIDGLVWHPAERDPEPVGAVTLADGAIWTTTQRSHARWNTEIR